MKVVYQPKKSGIITREEVMKCIAAFKSLYAEGACKIRDEDVVLLR